MARFFSLFVVLLVLNGCGKPLSPAPKLPASTGEIQTVPFNLVFSRVDDGRYTPVIPVIFHTSSIPAQAAIIPAGDWVFNGKSLVQPGGRYRLQRLDSGQYKILAIE